MLKALTRKQATFTAEYLIDMNATQAAIRAGYSPRTAAEIGSSLLKQPDVAAAIDRGMAQRASRVGMSQDDVLHEMSLLSHSNIAHYVINDDGTVSLAEGAPEGAMAAVQSIKRRRYVRTDKDGSTTVTYDTEIRLWDKPTPLKLMGRHVGLFPDRTEHTGPNGGPIPLEAIVTRVERIIIELPSGALSPRALTEGDTTNPAQHDADEEGYEDEEA